MARKGTYPSPSMALTITTVDPLPLRDPDPPPPPPPPPTVAITPCDPWPRPYYYSEGLRRVSPYHFTYNTFCKERWRGREILDIFASEFRDRTREYYKNAIESGQIALNGKACEDIHQVVKNGDVITHTLHRHEPPVTARPIRIMSETDSMLVIDKPAGVPVHPAGRYNYNTIVEIVRAERHYSFNPLPCNRLDRLTSGVMFVAKDKKDAERISEKLRGRTMRKEYIARVKGRFPNGEGEVQGDLGGVVKCEENILQISPILGLNRARASGKTAKTLFRRVAFYPPKEKPGDHNSNNSSSSTLDSVSTIPPKTRSSDEPSSPAPPLPATESIEGYSIVHCLPLTGRTHQIRVHLQFLGHPITNDPIYANRRVFGSKLAIHDSSAAQDEEIMRRLAKMGKTEVADAIDYNKFQDPYQADQTMQTCLPSADGTTAIEPSSRNNREEEGRGSREGDREGNDAGMREVASGKAKDLPFSTPAEFASFVAQHDAMVSDYNQRKGEKMTGEKCAVCATDLYSDPGPQELGIYLHALAYSDQAGAWEFRTEVPSWSLPPNTQIKAETENRRVPVGGDEIEAEAEAGANAERQRWEVVERETREVLGRGWLYDGSEVPPLEVDSAALNRAGLRRNKKHTGS